MALCRQRDPSAAAGASIFLDFDLFAFLKVFDFNDFYLIFYIFLVFYSIEKVKSFITALLLSGRAYDSQSNHLVFYVVSYSARTVF